MGRKALSTLSGRNLEGYVGHLCAQPVSGEEN